jgi:Enoyl-CoA hydratase/carnithine racemase
VLEVALHTNGGTLAFNGYTHEQFVDLFHAIGSDRDNRVVILTGSGNAFMETSVLKVSTSSPRKATTKSIARAGKSS